MLEEDGGAYAEQQARGMSGFGFTQYMARMSLDAVSFQVVLKHGARRHRAIIKLGGSWLMQDVRRETPTCAV